MSTEEKSTPLGGAPVEPEQATPRVSLPTAQLHNPDSPDNLLAPGKVITAADLQGPPLSASDEAELLAAEARLKKEQHRVDIPSNLEPPSSPVYPAQPTSGTSNREPVTTELPVTPPQGDEYEQRSLPGLRRNLELYSPPPLVITDEDRERLLECIIHNKYYSERFVKGPVEVVFRVKSSREVDFQRACLSKMSNDGEFGLMSDFQAAVARFNQLFQTVSYNGSDVPPVVIPPRPWKEGDLNLEEQYWKSWLSGLTESAGYIIHGLMIQFEDKVYRMQQSILDPDFFRPAAPSSSARG